MTEDPADDIEWTADGGKEKVVRGASFTVSPAAGWNATIFFRYLAPPTADAEVGFRCAWDKGMQDVAPAKTGDAGSGSSDTKAAAVPKACDDVEGMYQEARRLVGSNPASAISKAETAIARRSEAGRGATHG